jgi:hypothetical protein
MMHLITTHNVRFLQIFFDQDRVCMI